MSEDKTDDIEIELLLQGIFLRYKYDFREYSRASVKRRLKSAMSRLNVATVSGLQEKTLHQPEFFFSLLQYLTVPVTEMFRDPAYFQALREKVLPHLSTYPSLKLWVAGCSTGEEAYSLAILLEEEGLLDRSIIYATDINPVSLKKAEAGIYRLEDIQKYTANYQKAGGKRSLSDYYVADYGAVAFQPLIRKKILFTDHSLATDNVFSETHFISCRNVMIYFEPELQNRAVGLFTESLARQGFLGIGEKESLQFSPHAVRYESVDRGMKIYRKVLERGL
ncbi:MAG: protein-glutamate O-methyltransferase CheR [Cryobacterium sp.]|nr:protein-glutamate O-methyltransferase CheR [Oligoflexia bacterium]